MVVPLTHKPAWMPLLSSAPEWQPEAERLVILAPHPDDETLAVGGLIAAQAEQGTPIIVIAATDGEHAYADNNGLAAPRREEQALALEHLGVPRANLIRLGLTDSGLAAQEQT